MVKTERKVAGNESEMLSPKDTNSPHVWMGWATMGRYKADKERQSDVQFDQNNKARNPRIDSQKRATNGINELSLGTMLLRALG
jgi:hypothetical protein